jgi:CheY-like chemotaxis protein
MRVLVVEDQEGPLEAFVYHLTNNTPDITFDVAKWYSAAEEMIRSDQYDVIFLDHRMPYDDPGCTDADMNRFGDQLRNIGYGLIPLIREKMPSTIIIGTSSLSRDEIGRFEIPVRTIVKYESWTTLPAILAGLQQ